MTLSCIVCEIWRVIGRKSRNFYTPPVFSGAPAGVTPSEFAKMFDTHKTRMTELRCGEEAYDDMLSRFDRVPERDGQTDGRTDRIAIKQRV